MENKLNETHLMFWVYTKENLEKMIKRHERLLKRAKKETTIKKHGKAINEYTRILKSMRNDHIIPPECLEWIKQKGIGYNKL